MYTRMARLAALNRCPKPNDTNLPVVEAAAQCILTNRIAQWDYVMVLNLGRFRDYASAM